MPDLIADVAFCSATPARAVVSLKISRAWWQTRCLMGHALTDGWMAVHPTTVVDGQGLPQGVNDDLFIGLGGSRLCHTLAALCARRPTRQGKFSLLGRSDQELLLSWSVSS